MQPETQKSVDDVRASLRSRKISADSAFQQFKIAEIMKDPPAVELTHNGFHAGPALIKPRIR
jgi:hypothetical protein